MERQYTFVMIFGGENDGESEREEDCANDTAELERLGVLCRNCLYSRRAVLHHVSRSEFQLPDHVLSDLRCKHGRFFVERIS